jgi:hypothetical protein
MTNVKNMAAFVAAFVCVMMNFVLTSCQQDGEFVQKELAAPITVKEEVPVLVLQDKLYPVLSNVMISDHNIFINGKSVATYEVEHKYPTIEMPAADHKAASVETFDGETLRDSNGQQTNISVNIVSGNDYTLNATITPNSEYSKIQRLHAKVSMVTCYYTLSGYVTVTVDGETKSNDFSLTIARHYLLVDPSIDVETIVRTDTIEKLVVKTDTTIVEVEKIVEKIVNTTDTVYVDKPVEVIVNHTDTITVEVERFIKGADINKSVINDFGYSVGTLMLGNKQLLKVELRHAEPVLNVAEDQLGNVSFAAAGSLKWNGTDSQITTGTKESNNVTVKSFDYVRNEYTKVSETMVIVRTIYSVTGSFYNENNDLYEFSMELAPSYLQKVEAAPEPQIVTPEVNKYRGIIRKVTAEGLKLMTKPVVQQLVDGKWVDVRTCSRSCIGMSGSPSGLDLFVKSTKIIEETENSWNYSGNDATWAGDDTKSDGTIITKRTKVYEFNHMFEADAVNNGKVGPATQLYVMKAERVQVLDPENNLLTCTWEDGSEFSLNISVVLNNTEFVEKAEMSGKTRVESDKTYKYATSFVQHFTATVGGQKLQDVDATSTLWVPAN